MVYAMAICWALKDLAYHKEMHQQLDVKAHSSTPPAVQFVFVG